MPKVTASEAKENFEQLLNQSATSSEPVLITGEQHNVVLVSEKEWSGLQETLYLLSIPGMRESIKEGLAIPIEECDEELDW